jgi:UDP-2-acetamido-2,6-beta-L-arabino-hexul-4-ose reductase
MSVILITGSKGFIGKNLIVAFQRCANLTILTFDSNNSLDELDALIKQADFIFHLAGVNRPQNDDEFISGNIELTRQLCEKLIYLGKKVPFVFTSSTQATLDSAYGQSKYQAERIIIDYHKQTGNPVYIYRLPNVFGKWCRLKYNSVVATFCYNISRGLPVTISDRNNLIHFVYVGDVVKTFLQIIQGNGHNNNQQFYEIENIYDIKLGSLYDLIINFEQSRHQGILPDLQEPFVKHLYSTYISYLDPNYLSYPVELKVDNRGWLFELIKTTGGGQIFVSSTQPGVIRGNHYHDSKVEKFCVIKGKAMIRFRSILGEDINEYPVNGTDIKILDIPPGYTHSIENIGNEELITIFWANEIFDSSQPDTWSRNVL